MAAIKHLPHMVKVGKAWVIENFQPPKGAVEWNKTGNKTATLYVIECAGFCKIGYAANFETRFSALDCANPLPLRKVALRSVSEASIAYVEAWVHHRFADRRTKGEWFAVPPNEILSVLPEALRRGKVYANHCRRWFEESEREKRTPEAQEWARKNYAETIARHKREYEESIMKINEELVKMAEPA